MGDGIDARIAFNSDFNWDFSSSRPINSNAYDFVDVAAHEIGHSLGFFSSVDDLRSYNRTLPDSNSLLNVSALDLFRYSADSTAQKAIDFTLSGTDKYFSLDGGKTKIASFETGQGYQASHWLDNQGIGIMDPTSALGETRGISDRDLRAFDAIGWNRLDVANSTAVPEPSNYLGTFIFVAFGVKTIVKRRQNLAKMLGAEASSET